MKYEIFNNGGWLKVSKNIFHAWTGRRRQDGLNYIGPVVWLASKKEKKRKRKKLPSLKIRLQRSLESV